MSKARIEAFSDAVIAVAITLLALDLRVPVPGGTGSLAHRLGEQWPLTIGVLPFSTALMAEYLNAARGQNFAAVIYGGSFLLMSLAFFAMQRHLLLTKQHLLQDHLTPEVRRTVLRRNAIGLLPYAVATVAGIVSPL
jgi:uncharacterized membrane protein